MSVHAGVRRTSARRAKCVIGILQGRGVDFGKKQRKRNWNLQLGIPTFNCYDFALAAKKT